MRNRYLLGGLVGAYVMANTPWRPVAFVGEVIVATGSLTLVCYVAYRTAKS